MSTFEVPAEAKKPSKGVISEENLLMATLLQFFLHSMNAFANSQKALKNTQYTCKAHKFTENFPIVLKLNLMPQKLVQNFAHFLLRFEF